MDPNMLLLNDYLVSRSRIQLLCPNMGTTKSAGRRLPPRMLRSGGCLRECGARVRAETAKRGSLLFAFLGRCSGASLDILNILFGKGTDMAHPDDGKRLSLC